MRRPPRLAAAILRWLAGPEDADYVLNDLGEEFDLVARGRTGRAGVSMR